MKQQKLQAFFIVPLALAVLAGLSGGAMAHDRDKAGHRHSDRGYSTKYRQLDHNPKYRSIKQHKHKPHAQMTIHQVHGNKHGHGRGHHEADHKSHHQGHHHGPRKYVYVPLHRYYRHHYPQTGYSIRYYGDNVSIGLRQWH